MISRARPASPSRTQIRGASDWPSGRSPAAILQCFAHDLRADVPFLQNRTQAMRLHAVGSRVDLREAIGRRFREGRLGDFRVVVPGGVDLPRRVGQKIGPRHTPVGNEEFVFAVIRAILA